MAGTGGDGGGRRATAARSAGGGSGGAPVAPPACQLTDKTHAGQPTPPIGEVNLIMLRPDGFGMRV